MGAQQDSSTRRPLDVRHKIGLKAVRVSHRHAGWVVVHDPVASKYHRLREDEYFLLTLLDGHCSLDDLRDHYQTRYPNRRVRPGQLNALLFRFHESGLTISHSAGQGTSLLRRADQDRRQKIWSTLSQWLFLRFPGVDPAPVMRWLMPIARPWLSWPGIITLTAFVASAALLMLVHRDRYVAELPSAGQWMTMQNALILAAVVALTKIAHELGHALVSERFGAKCRSIGPMLLVFTPALYCDTSGSWLIADRWKRACIALAGIGTEIIIASVAAWVWVMTPVGLVHTIASHVMVVCGISTVVFNANPLLRYDGYYLLSDWTDMPNLSQRAKRAWGRMLSSVFLGLPANRNQGEPADHSGWLLLYAAASLAYRWVLMFTIIGFIWVWLRPYGLEIIGQCMAIFAIASMALGTIVPLKRFWTNPMNRRKARWSRILIWAVILIAVGFAGTIPLPRSVATAVRFSPLNETRVHLTSGGVLTRVVVQPGDKVLKGDLLAELTNPDVQRECLDAASALRDQETRLEGLRSSQTLVPEASHQLPAAEALRDELASRLKAAQRRRDALAVNAPCDGTVMVAQSNPTGGISGPNGMESLDADANPLGLQPESNPAIDRTAVRLASWSGDPTSPENIGCTLEAGTELLAIIPSEHSSSNSDSPETSDIPWRAEAVVTAVQRRRMRPGQTVTLIRDNAPTEVLLGKIADIAEETYDARVDTPRRDHRQADSAVRTPQTSYLVNISLVDSPTNDDLTLLGGSGKAKIRVEPASLWQRIYEVLSSLFRFR
ncbi:peptidase M50 [Rhodopirellula sp. JC740]|uniref:Peptidase M50 n=1 Tax=Rhodopirellula halodulae TaxID=2894198 RepID=A0ABS8NBJ7_9BACT|nr:site-2 protease family protein [Rhodopirellula sp. JC740]MCC9640928.1 peptidase M50 [Rhodopirellula sp. JC740]